MELLMKKKTKTKTKEGRFLGPNISVASKQQH